MAQIAHSWNSCTIIGVQRVRERTGFDKKLTTRGCVTHCCSSLLIHHHCREENGYSPADAVAGNNETEALNDLKCDGGENRSSNGKVVVVAASAEVEV